MLCHGDELGGTQVGNNNVYCQDSELGWIDWDAARDSEALTRFTAQLVRLRAEHPLFAAATSSTAGPSATPAPPMSPGSVVTAPP